MDLSNKSLALLLVGAILLSLGGTIVSLNKLSGGVTGFATGQLNLSISSTASCAVDTNVTLGTGSQPTATYSLTTDKNNSLTTTFNDCVDASLNNNCKGLQINNTGNVNLNITFSSSHNASSLLTSQTNLDITDFRYIVRNGTAPANASNGCRNLTNQTAQIENLPLNVLQATTQTICQNLTYTDGSDIMHVEFNITLEPDVFPGEKTATITIACAQN